MQNGAESVIRTLADAGIDVCFANPGTSEMQYVDALDRTRLMRCILGLFEGVVTGAADGYARMTRRPALSLLHLAPGLANACANLHNARKARTPMLTLIGDHAVRHLRYDAPLSGDVLGAVTPFADWTRTATSAAQLGADAAAALAAALSRGGQGAALISPADLGWDEGGVAAPAVAPMPPEAIAPAAVQAAARLLGPDVLLLPSRAPRAWR
ncbi:MAG: thiamine pyrophosphate-binding protein [Rubrimonas sp.]